MQRHRDTQKDTGRHRYTQRARDIGYRNTGGHRQTQEDRQREIKSLWSPDPLRIGPALLLDPDDPTPDPPRP